MAWFKKGIEGAIEDIEREDETISSMVTKEEKQLLKLDEEIQKEFATLQVALATTKQYFRGHTYTPTHVLNVTTTLRTLKMKFEKVAEIASKANTASMRGLAAYGKQVAEGIGALIQAINTKTIQFGKAAPRQIEGVNDIIDYLEQLVQKASAGVDRAIKQRYQFLESYQETKRAA